MMFVSTKCFRAQEQIAFKLARARQGAEATALWRVAASARCSCPSERKKKSARLRWKHFDEPIQHTQARKHTLSWSSVNSREIRIYDVGKKKIPYDEFPAAVHREVTRTTNLERGT